LKFTQKKKIKILQVVKLLIGWDLKCSQIQIG